MALREVVKNNLEFLHKKSRPVEKFDDKLCELVEDMKETLIKERGVGLAAPQVGILRRIFIIDIGDEDKSEFKEFINPQIIRFKGKNDKYYEGCLSFPGRSFKITRPHFVTVEAYDVHGNKFKYEAEDFLARAVFHENDHLNGVTLVDSGKEVFDKD